MATASGPQRAHGTLPRGARPCYCCVMDEYEKLIERLRGPEQYLLRTAPSGSGPTAVLFSVVTDLVDILREERRALDATT